MSKMRCLSFILLVCFTGSLFIPVEHVRAAYSIPAEANLYLQAGEKIQAIHPVTMNGRQYTLVYYQTQDNTDSEGGILYDTRPNKWQSSGITGIMVFDGCAPITDETVLRQVLLTELSGYILTQVNEIPKMITVEPDLLEQMKRPSENPVYVVAFGFQNIERLFKTPEEEYLEALRSMLSPHGDEVDLVNQFAEDTGKLVENGDSIADALEQTQKLAKYANDRSIRTFAKGADKYFDGWDIISGSQKVKIEGVDVEYFNALKLFQLALILFATQDLSLERAEMLDRFATAADNGEIQVDQAMLWAIHAVVAEARDANLHKADLVIQFLRDNVVDFGISATEEVLAEKWAHWAFQTYGTRIAGHAVAGMASAVLVGFTLSNLLYGMDEVFYNSVTGVKASELEDMFTSAAGSMKNSSSQPYDYHDADIFRTSVFFKNIAAAQVYRSFAGEVKSGRLITLLGNIFTGGQWDEAIKVFEEQSSTGEQDIEDLIGKTEIIDSAIDGTITRQALYTGNSSSPTSATLMLFDVSGSMSETDLTGTVKLEAAKTAGERILDIVDSENLAMCTSVAQLGIASFSDHVVINDALANSTSSARSALDSLYSSGGTGMPDGLRLAIDQFQNKSGVKPIIIMLSDGMPNIGLGGDNSGLDPSIVRQQVLDLATEAGNKGICIYTVGFGIPGTVVDPTSNAYLDEDFLKQVSANSGCGRYYNAQNATELANVYIALRHESTGNVLLKNTGSISQGQTVNIGDVNIPGNQSMFLFTLNWPGSQLDAKLTDPKGKVVDTSYPDATISTSATLVSIIVQNPRSGKWNVSAQGVDVPEQTTTYNAVLSVRGGSTSHTSASPGPAFAFIILIIAAALVAVYVSSQSKRQPRFATAAVGARGSLVGLSGTLKGQAFQARDGMMIGRSSTCEVRLLDLAVSRLHAHLRFAGGHWYIQDRNSKGGIFVNGVRVPAATLKNGDHIRIGSTEFEFKE